MLKGMQGVDAKNFPHWLPLLSKALPGVPWMPVACKQVALNAIEVAKQVWPHLTFAEPLFETEFPKRFVLLLDLENDTCK